MSQKFINSPDDFIRSLVKRLEDVKKFADEANGKPMENDSHLILKGPAPMFSSHEEAQEAFDNEDILKATTYIRNKVDEQLNK